MGRKSKKAGEESAAAVKPTCFYCQRSFENEEVLISHQKLLHFRCPECGKKFSNAPGMAYHMKIMHNLELKTVPKAEPGRDDPTLNIVGTTGVPTEEERAQKRAKMSSIESLVDAAAASVLVISGSGANSTAAAADITPLVPQLAVIKGLVYADEMVSPEEKRAILPRYRVDEDSLKKKLAEKDASIEARLKEALASRNRLNPAS